MKDDIVQIAIRTLNSGRIASAFCIGFLFFTFAFIQFSAYMPEVSSTLGAPPLIVASGISVICYSAGLISTYAITWLLPKFSNAISKIISCAASLIASHVSNVKSKTKERNAINSAISQLTDNERKFLTLFSNTEASDLLRNKEHLPYMVYIASESLVRKKILTCIKNNTSHEKFSIQPKIKRKVERIAFNGYKLNSSVVLDLARVQGSGASGGGATGSR